IPVAGGPLGGDRRTRGGLTGQSHSTQKNKRHQTSQKHWLGSFTLFFSNFLGARWERSVRRALLQCAINVGTRRRNYAGQSRPLLFAFLEHSWIRRTNNKCNSFFPDTLELIGSHGHVAEGRVGQNYAIAEDAADNHEVVHTFAVNGDDDRDLQVGQL